MLVSLLTLTIGVIALVAVTSFLALKKPAKKPRSESAVKPSTEHSTAESWQEEGLRIAGRWADAEVVKLGDGKYRIYYTVEPEVPDNQKEMYSSISSDGLHWQQEKGIRMKNNTFPDVVKLADGRWRMYYQSFKANSKAGPELGIFSSISEDGLDWEEEEGIRIKVGFQGKYDTESVGAPSTIRLPDNRYFMIYRGSSGKNRFGKRDPVDNKLKPIDYLISATSTDGVHWQPGNLVVDSDNQYLRDQVDGPELVYDNNVLKLYYWSFPGVYLKKSTNDGRTWSKAKLVIKSTGPNHAPGDPTVIRQGKLFRMYFGLHTRGIFSAKLAIQN